MKYLRNNHLSTAQWSLRSSERGLKYYAKYLTPVVRESLRSSERGLKYNCMSYIGYANRSLRSSERGLKCRMIDGKTVDDTVAPFVGAWIEMLEDLEWNVDDDVAPFVGAWIEILLYPQLINQFTSLRSSERGLKYSY